MPSRARLSSSRRVGASYLVCKINKTAAMMRTAMREPRQGSGRGLWRRRVTADKEDGNGVERLALIDNEAMATAAFDNRERPNIS